MLDNLAKKKELEMGFTRTQMQKDMVLSLLKERGCRITKQRKMLLDVTLEDNCTCCKEIYYKASKRDPKIGSATVYRMVNVLEEIGAINRGNMYKVSCGSCSYENACTIELNDATVISLSAKKWNDIIETGLKACGYITEQKISNVQATQLVFEN